MRPEPFRLEGYGTLEPWEVDLVQGHLSGMGMSLDDFKARPDVACLLRVRQYLVAELLHAAQRKRAEKAEAALRAIPGPLRWLCVAFRSAT